MFDHSFEYRHFFTESFRINMNKCDEFRFWNIQIHFCDDDLLILCQIISFECVNRAYIYIFF